MFYKMIENGLPSLRQEAVMTDCTETAELTMQYIPVTLRVKGMYCKKQWELVFFFEKGILTVAIKVV